MTQRNIRIGQQLSAGYNPDGTPGTISTGVPGPAGPPPTDAQVLAAVSTYLSTHPLAAGGSANLASQKVGSTRALTAFGVGADGSSGSFVAIGDNGSTVDGYVVVDGSAPNSNLHLRAKGTGAVFLDGSVTSSAPMTLNSPGPLTINSDVYLYGDLLFGDTGRTGQINVGAIVCRNTMIENMQDSFIQNLQAGNSYFSGSRWSLVDDYTRLAPIATPENVYAGVAVTAAFASGTYVPVTASAFNPASDRRFKTDIAPLSGALAEVRTTQAYSYLMNDEPRRGLIADEAPAELVRTDSEGYQSIDLYGLVGTLWGAVRELADKIEGMEQTCRCPQTR